MKNILEVENRAKLPQMTVHKITSELSFVAGDGVYFYTIVRISKFC